jgi:jumonji domain-containing protein 2
MANTSCPVFYPTEEEFKDFNGYIRFLEGCLPNTIGLCKVVPPKTWQKPNHSDEHKSQIKVDNAIRQQLNGQDGCYKLNLFDVKRKWTSTSFREYALEHQCDFPCTAEDYDEDYQNSYNSSMLIEERERRFWKEVTRHLVQAGPVYGADIPGGFFSGTF